MNCLENHIGIKYCNSPEPESGLYINQLSGITLERIEKSSEKDNLNFLGVWKDIKSRAWMILEKDVRRQMRQKYKLKAVKSNNNLVGVLDETATIAAATKYRGVVIDLSDKTSFIAIGINSIAVWLTTGSALTVKVFDKEGVELDSFIVQSAIAGRNLISVGKKYLSSYVFIAVDCTSVPLYTSELDSQTSDSICNCIAAYYDCDPIIYGAESDISSPIPVQGDNMFGVEADFSVMCDYSGIICRNKTEFTDVWLYLLGAELMLESINSTKLSWFNTVDRDNAIERRDYYMNEYQQALAETIAAIEVPEDECCVECNPIIKSVYALP